MCDEVRVHDHRSADHRGEPIGLVDGDRWRLCRGPQLAAAQRAPRRCRTPTSRSGRRARCLRASAPPGPAAATAPQRCPPSPGWRPRSCGCPAGTWESRMPPRTGSWASPHQSSAPPTRPATASGRSNSAVSLTGRSTPCRGSCRTPADRSPRPRGRWPATTRTSPAGRPRSAVPPGLARMPCTP